MTAPRRQAADVVGCSNRDCCLHYAHSGPCDTKGDPWIPFDDVPFSQSVARHQWHSRGQHPRTCRKCWAEFSKFSSADATRYVHLQEVAHIDGRDPNG